MTEFIIVGLAAAPFLHKLYQLRVLHLERGIVHLEFGEMRENKTTIKRQKSGEIKKVNADLGRHGQIASPRSKG